MEDRPRTREEAKRETREALLLAEHIVVMGAGKIISSDSKAALLQRESGAEPQALLRTLLAEQPRVDHRFTLEHFAYTTEDRRGHERHHHEHQRCLFHRVIVPRRPCAFSRRRRRREPRGSTLSERETRRVVRSCRGSGTDSCCLFDLSIRYCGSEILAVLLVG